MRTTEEFLSALLRLGVKVWAEGDRLRFTAPKGAMSAELRAELAERKAQVMALLSESGGALDLSAQPLMPVPRGGPLPLSFAQERLWFLEQLEGDSPAYNIPAVLRLEGELDARAVEQSLAEIVRRHEVLRTTFPSVNGGAVQSIAPPGTEPFALPLTDLRHLTEPERSSELRRLTEEEARRPFDLSTGPLLRASLVRLGRDSHVLLLTMHHIVSDGWSMGVFIRELGALYGSFVRGVPLRLAELPVQYADFAVWQRRRLTGAALDEQLSYWRRQLAGAPTLLELPTDYPRPPVQSYRAAAEHFAVDARLTRRLKELSGRCGATLFMTLLAAYAALLSRYSGQDEIVVGSPIANRNRTELETLIGFFINTLALRVSLAGDPTFEELVRRVRQVALDAYAHQELPFEKLVAELRPERSLGYSPVFQAMFILQNNPVGSLEIPGLRRTSLEMDVGVVRCDLSLSIEETEQGLKGLWTYKPELFDAATIRRMSGRFQSLLGRAAQSPDAAVTELTCGEPPELPSLPPPAQTVVRAPLSYHQERLWFIDQFETGSVYEENPTYHNIPVILRLRGRVDARLLEESINAVVARHDALRTRCAVEGGAAFQEVSARASLKLKLAETEGAGEVSFERAVETCLAEAHRPFALDRDLLVRATLFHVSPEESLLSLVFHHMVADKASTRLVVRELAEVYGAREQGREPRLAQSPLQYTQYTLWQRALTDEALEPLLFYWKYQLGGKLRPLELPTDRPRPAVHVYRDARHDFRLGEGLARAVTEAGRSVRGGEFTVLLAGFKALLRRYARQETIVVGVSDPCRRRPEAQNLIGPVANLLALRSELSAGTTFRTLLAQVGRTLEHARAHGEMPFDKLVLELNPEKDMSRTALFDVRFDYEEDGARELAMGSLGARFVETGIGYGKYDLDLSLRREGDELLGTAVYNGVIFDPPAVEQLMRHFGVLLDSLLREPDGHVDDVELLGEAERQRQLVTWNSTAATYPRDHTLDRLFEEQVERTPEALAVVCGDERLTYRELDARANRIAHHLRSLGAGRDMLVAVCLERSCDLVAALLGVLKAGAAYLPLEAAFPHERLRFMLEDARVSLVITERRLLNAATEKVARLILLDADDETISAQPSTPPARAASAGDLAYCIYTSGSTGEPKGVLLEHRNVVRLLMNERPLFDFNERDVWTMFHSCCFDFSVWEMYGALLRGGRLVVVSSDATKDPRLFLELLAREEVTVLNQTPSAFYSLAREALEGPRAQLALRYVIYGGEALHPARLRAWRKAYPEVTLVNMYGITETTVHVTFKEVSEAEVESDASNIGRPIPTTTTYVLDERLRLLPVGVPGEICVGGDGVGRGYLRRGALTGERFVPNPFRPGERLYRSGDLAKLVRNGEMLYLGRIDDQVQTRGFRVELEEIRHNLLKHPAVAEAVVVARPGRSQTTEIIAYVVPSVEVSLIDPKSPAAPSGDAGTTARPLYQLPNGMEVFYQNKNETDFLYEEIFEQQTYFRHGITLNDGDCVFDVGANIGLFTLFVSQTSRDSVVYAFEPIPAIFEALRLNSECYGSNVKLFECGLAREARRETFIFYPHVSIFSGRFAEPAKEQEIIKSFLLNRQTRSASEGGLGGAELDELLSERMTAEPVECELRSLSDVIGEHGVGHIDLLKIDVEKSELDLLAGIEERDWPKIKQLVMEVHNVDDRLGRIKALLESKGFDLVVEQEDGFKETSNYNLYAVRPANGDGVARRAGRKLVPRVETTRKSSHRLVRELRDFLGGRLPDYMMPSAFVLLDKLPLTSGGKVDRRALPAPEQADSAAEPAFVAPRTPVERRVAAIWMEVLGLKQVGARQNFFELGGHSLLATQVISRLRDAFSVTVPVHSLFESPTVEGLARAVERATKSRAEENEPVLASVSREAHRTKLSSVEKGGPGVRPKG